MAAVSPLVVVIAASGITLLALLALAVICACVLASRADDYLESASDPFDVQPGVDFFYSDGWTDDGTPVKVTFSNVTSTVGPVRVAKVPLDELGIDLSDGFDWPERAA